jgi:TolB protein
MLLAASNDDGDLDIVLLDAITGQFLARLTDLPGDEQLPHWLPDGSGFIFSADEGTSGWAVYAGDMDGNLTQLTHSGHFDGIAFPSPDGRQIVFYSSRDDDYEIYIMDIDGRNQTRLTTSRGRDASPVFSPDGQWVAFESDRDGDYELFAMRPDGSDVRKLTSNQDGDWVPMFSPDGKWLLFQSDRNGNMDIYRMPFEP